MPGVPRSFPWKLAANGPDAPAPEPFNSCVSSSHSNEAISPVMGLSSFAMWRLTCPKKLYPLRRSISNNVSV